MSIKKRLSALLIAVVLISSITILPVSAVSDDEIDVSECENYAQHIINDLMSTGVRRPYAGNYYNKSGDLADELLDVAYKYEKGEVTAVELQNKYDETKEFYENPWISPCYAEQTCYVAVHEQNYNNWYTDEQWNTFIEKRDNLLQALRVIDSDLEPAKWGSVYDYDYTVKQQKYISKCFYELLYIYNEMTCKDIIQGDVNRDGVVNVSDATLIQKYIVGEVNFTGAQELRAKVNVDSYSVSVKDATLIQKYIVDPSIYFYSRGIVKNESEFATSLDNWQICSQW